MCCLQECCPQKSYFFFSLAKSTTNVKVCCLWKYLQGLSFPFWCLVVPGSGAKVLIFSKSQTYERIMETIILNSKFPSSLLKMAPIWKRLQEGLKLLVLDSEDKSVYILSFYDLVSSCGSHKNVIIDISGSVLDPVQLWVEVIKLLLLQAWTKK